ncbi:MAG: hypothetical protein JST70_10245 [Bacteroidetes bacterium]|nr:hypothetical protein [Bacteroidota bacterium]
MKKILQIILKKHFPLQRQKNLDISEFKEMKKTFVTSPFNRSAQNADWRGFFAVSLKGTDFCSQAISFQVRR